MYAVLYFHETGRLKTSRDFLKNENTLITVDYIGEQLFLQNFNIYYQLVTKLPDGLDHNARRTRF
jgi:hypothetical protein